MYSIEAILHIYSKFWFTSSAFLFHSSFLGLIPETVTFLFWETIRFARSTIGFATFSELFSELRSLVPTCIIVWSGFLSLMHGFTLSFILLNFAPEKLLTCYAMLMLSLWYFFDDISHPLWYVFISLVCFHHAVTNCKNFHFYWMIFFLLM